ARLELGELLAVRRERVGERMEEARALGRRSLPPGPVERRARRGNGPIHIALACELRCRERLAGRGLDELTGLRALDDLAADEEANVALDRGAHASDDIEAATRGASLVRHMAELARDLREQREPHFEPRMFPEARGRARHPAPRRSDARRHPT